jgi:hypothetical protein
MTMKKNNIHRAASTARNNPHAVSISVVIRMACSCYTGPYGLPHMHMAAAFVRFSPAPPSSRDAGHITSARPLSMRLGGGDGDRGPGPPRTAATTQGGVGGEAAARHQILDTLCDGWCVVSSHATQRGPQGPRSTAHVRITVYASSRGMPPPPTPHGPPRDGRACVVDGFGWDRGEYRDGAAPTRHGIRGGGVWEGEDQPLRAPHALSAVARILNTRGSDSLHQIFVFEIITAHAPRRSSRWPTRVTPSAQTRSVALAPA